MNDLHNKVKKATRKSLSFAKNMWVSGTSVSNYLLKDPVIDWLKTYYNTLGLNNTRITRSKIKKNKVFNINLNNNLTTNNVLMKNGCHFEDKIYEDLEKKFGKDVVNLKYSRHFTETEKETAFTKTLAEITKLTPIILQAYIKSDKLKLEGVTDILIRSDYLSKLVKIDNVVSNDNNHLHYVVVDVKWSHMTLCVDGKTIRNDGRFKAYKGQLLIYNIILGEIQNYTPPRAYVMAKSWTIDKKGDEQNGHSCYDLLGVIDYSGRDSTYIDETMKAINWVRDVRTNGSGWSPLNPHIKELCCNSCNQDDVWSGVKKNIMNETKDITQIWMVTPDHRNIAFDQGIKRWDDKRCQASLFMSDGVRSKTINQILEINQDTSSKINLNNIDNRSGWRTNTNTNTNTRDFYIDYETISEAFVEKSGMDINNGKLLDGYIFMIGVGYEDADGTFIHTSFVCDEYTHYEEQRIIIEFISFLNSFSNNFSNIFNDNHIRLFHWGHVEKTLMDSALIRHSPYINWSGYTNIKWVDMCSVFTTAPVVVKGSLSFKLKDIAKAMFKNGLISTVWESGELENGLVAMQHAIKYYSTTCSDNNNLTSIKKYNMIDCKVIWDIVKYLRCIR